MTDRLYIEQIADPITGEVITFRAATDAELDRLVQEHFGIDQEDRESRSGDHFRGGDCLDGGGKSNRRRPLLHPVAGVPRLASESATSSTSAMARPDGRTALGGPVLPTGASGSPVSSPETEGLIAIVVRR